MKPTLKSWATPLAIGAFIISGVTGVLIFFHIETGLVEPVHKWLSWLLVGGVFTHVLANRKAFGSYFSKNTALGIIGASMLVTALAVMPFLGDGGEKHREKRAARTALRALESSSLETLAPVLKTTPEALKEQLRARGMEDIETSMSITDIAAAGNIEPGELLAGLMGADRRRDLNDSKED